MKFMLQVRFNGADKAIGGLTTEEQESVTAEFQDVRRSPGVLDGNQLHGGHTAVTVRVEDGRPQVVAGLAVPAGSELDGYYLYDAADRDAAVEFAARIPAARYGGSVEVRPVFER